MLLRIIEDILIYGYIQFIDLFFLFYYIIWPTTNKNKNVRLNYQKAYYQEHKEEIKKYTKQYYELNKTQMKKKRKSSVPVKRKQKEEGSFFISHEEITLSWIE